MSNSVKLTAGQEIRIKPEYQDAGDNKYRRTVVEDRDDRVLVATHGVLTNFTPMETIHKCMLELPESK